MDSAALLIIGSGILGLLFAALYAYHTSLILLTAGGPSGSHSEHLITADEGVYVQVRNISQLIATGADTFLMKEYRYMVVFIVGFSAILLVFLGLRAPGGWEAGVYTTIAFVLGSVTSIVSGYIGMKIAVYANSRTAVSALQGYGPAFRTSFKAGCVMGFALVSLGLLVLYVTIELFKLHFVNAYTNSEATALMYECIAGYGLGGSSIALFGRVGGGIYTKAADVGADLVGKVEQNMNEDDPKNPACIADNVGDNVGDIAGMGADLFGSFAESSCAAMVIAAQSPTIGGLSNNATGALYLPLIITAAGILVCIVTSFVATHMCSVRSEAEIEPALKRQLLVSTILMTPVSYGICASFLPATFKLTATLTAVTNTQIFICICMGLWSGLIIGYITEYFTSHSYSPVRQVAASCETGAATNIIYGLALGYKSVVIPVLCLAATIYVSYSYAGMFGIACAALGILSTLPIGLTIDAYGPICDNAGGIAEMSGMDEEVRERTDALDAAGNTTAAIGKGFAIGSAALVSLALFGAFVTTVSNSPNPADNLELKGVNILRPWVFSGLLVGAMLPYWFSAMTMKSVGKAALKMVQEVRRQFRENPAILTGEAPADYESCIAIATDASLKEMIPPGALVMLTPLIVGFLFGVEALAGLLVGALVSGVQMAISSSNTGGAWDNAKKYIEGDNLGEGKGKGTDYHVAAVIGDTVGDPLKDTSGPALNILIKLSAIISLVFAHAFFPLSKGGLVEQLFA